MLYKKTYKMRCKDKDIFMLGLLALIAFTAIEYSNIIRYLHGSCSRSSLLFIQIIAAMDLFITFKQFNLYFIKKKVAVYMGILNTHEKWYIYTRTNLVPAYVTHEAVYFVTKEEFRRASSFFKEKKMTIEQFITEGELVSKDELDKML